MSGTKNVYQRGNRWYYRFELGGVERRRVIPGATTEAEAVKIASELRGRAAAGTLPDQLARVSTRFDDRLADFLRNYCPAKLKASTAKRYEVSAKPLAAYFTGTDLALLRRGDIAAFATARRNGFVGGGQVFAPVHTATVRRDLALLSRIYTRDINLDLLERNPVADFDKSELPEAEQRVRFLSADEYRKLIDAAQRIDPHFAQAVIFAAGTGLRANEQFQLTWDRVDIEQGTVRLDAKHTKTSRPRVVPLDPASLAVVKARVACRALCRLVFCFQDTAGQWCSFKPAYTGRRLHRALKEAGIDDFRWHDLRHHAASMWVQKGSDLYPVSKLLGHASVRTTERYAHLNADALRRVVEG
jgi:integrase/recombinase XerD